MASHSASAVPKSQQQQEQECPEPGMIPDLDQEEQEWLFHLQQGITNPLLPAGNDQDWGDLQVRNTEFSSAWSTTEVSVSPSGRPRGSSSGEIGDYPRALPAPTPAPPQAGVQQNNQQIDFHGIRFSMDPPTARMKPNLQRSTGGFGGSVPKKRPGRHPGCLWKTDGTGDDKSNSEFPQVLVPMEVGPVWGYPTQNPPRFWCGSHGSEASLGLS